MGCLVPKIPSTGDAQLTCIVYTMHIVVVQLKPGSQACRSVRAAKNPDETGQGKGNSHETSLPRADMGVEDYWSNELARDVRDTQTRSRRHHVYSSTRTPS